MSWTVVVAVVVIVVSFSLSGAGFVRRARANRVASVDMAGNRVKVGDLVMTIAGPGTVTSMDNGFDTRHVTYEVQFPGDDEGQEARPLSREVGPGTCLVVSDVRHGDPEVGDVVMFAAENTYGSYGVGVGVVTDRNALGHRVRNITGVDDTAAGAGFVEVKLSGWSAAGAPWQ